MVYRKPFGKRLEDFHWGIVIVVSILALFGCLMLFSAAQGHLKPWALQQGLRFIFMFPVMMMIAVVDIKVWIKFAYVIYAAAIGFLIMVELMGFIGMGAQRWVNLGGFNFQPSEFMKIALVLALARFFHYCHSNDIDRLVSIAIPLFLIATPAVLILKQPNLGTASMVIMTGAVLMFLAGMGWKKFAFAGASVLAAIPLIWQFMHDYQKKRVLTFLNPEADPLGAGYNIMQSKIAIGSGGIFGKGYLHGTQSQLNFLPEKETDFIFTMLAEEFGMMGGLTVIALYFSLIWMCWRIALSCNHQFGRLVAGGVGIVLFLHVMINMAMVMGLIPVVGVPLPLLSWGGSVLITMMIGMGFVLNAHLYRDARLDRDSLVYI